MLKVNSWTEGYRPKAHAEAADYKTLCAEPVMSAIDEMPRPYRDLVNEYGYVDVYRAWKRGIAPGIIKARAEKSGGVFVL